MHRQLTGNESESGPGVRRPTRTRPGLRRAPADRSCGRVQYRIRVCVPVCTGSSATPWRRLLWAWTAAAARAPRRRPRRPATGFRGRLLGFENPEDRREMQGFLLCPPLEGLPLSAFICGLYIQHNPCITHVEKSSVSNLVFLLLCRNKNLLMIGAYTNFDCRPSELQRVLASKS